MIIICIISGLRERDLGPKKNRMTSGWYTGTWYLVKNYLSSVDYCTRLNVTWTCHFLQRTRKTWPCLTGHSVVNF